MSSLISTGLSSNSVFLLATVNPKMSASTHGYYIRLNARHDPSSQNPAPDTDADFHIRSASLPSFSIVPVMPFPISAALLANSDLAPFLADLATPLTSPLALLCVSVSRDCLCAPTFVDDCRFCACARTARNSAVRSCIEAVIILRASTCRKKMAPLL